MKSAQEVGILACQQIVDEMFKEMASVSRNSQNKMLIFLYLFAQKHPKLLVNGMCSCLRKDSSFNYQFIACATEILKEITPIWKSDGKSACLELERNLLLLVDRESPSLIDNCLRCLSILIGKSTRDYQNIRRLLTR